MPTGTQHTHKLSLGLALEAPTRLRMRNFLIIANFRLQLFTSRKILRLPLEKLPIYEYAAHTRKQFTPATVAHTRRIRNASLGKCALQSGQPLLSHIKLVCIKAYYAFTYCFAANYKLNAQRGRTWRMRNVAD